MCVYVYGIWRRCVCVFGLREKCFWGSGDRRFPVDEVMLRGSRPAASSPLIAGDILVVWFAPLMCGGGPGHCVCEGKPPLRWFSVSALISRFMKGRISGSGPRSARLVLAACEEQNGSLRQKELYRDLLGDGH